jgi:hypothetical protein
MVLLFDANSARKVTAAPAPKTAPDVAYALQMQNRR